MSVYFGYCIRRQVDYLLHSAQDIWDLAQTVTRAPGWSFSTHLPPRTLDIHFFLASELRKAIERGTSTGRRHVWSAFDVSR